MGGLVDRMWTFPPTGSTGAEITAFAHAHRPALLVAMVLNTIAITLWLVFGAGVLRWLREAHRGEGFLSACLVFGFAGFVTLLFAGFTSFFVLAYRGSDAPDPRLLYDLAFGLIAMSGLPTALALGAYAAFVFRADHPPRWTAWLAIVAAVAHIALLASFVVPSGFFSLEGGVIIAIPGTLFVWIVATGFLMLRAEAGRLVGS